MLNVLIVDDEKIERLAMRKFMTDWLPEYIAGEAENGKRRLNSCAEPVHLVLMDIQMPGMHGLTAIKQIKAISPHTKFYYADSLRYLRLCQAGDASKG
ncbi:response regulator [Bacillus sp. SL00103]